MCGRYVLAKMDEIEDYYDLPSFPWNLKPRYNVAPGQEMPVITRNKQNELQIMKWGLVPSWADDPKIGYKMINARAETLKLKPSFKNPLQRSRCLIPASGFFEWEKTKTEKIPYYFYLRNKSLFSFAGLYDVWKDKDGRELKTYTIITTESNKLVSKFHNRMPAILNPENEDIWLNKETGIDVLTGLLNPFPESNMETYHVSSNINTTKSDSKDLITPINH